MRARGAERPYAVYSRVIWREGKGKGPLLTAPRTLRSRGPVTLTRLISAHYGSAAGSRWELRESCHAAIVMEIPLLCWVVLPPVCAILSVIQTERMPEGGSWQGVEQLTINTLTRDPLCVSKCQPRTVPCARARQYGQAGTSYGFLAPIGIGVLQGGMWRKRV